MSVTAKKLCPKCVHGGSATLIGVPYTPVPVETTALDVLHRAGWAPVSRDDVTRWFADRSQHAGACACWRCEAASAADAGRVWRCLRAWGRTTVVPPPAPTAAPRGIDRRPLPEQIRVLRETGLSMGKIAVALHCSASTVHKYLHTG